MVGGARLRFEDCRLGKIRLKKKKDWGRLKFEDCRLG